MRFCRLFLPLFLLLCALPAHADTVTDLQALLGSLRTMQGEFTQTVVNRSGKTQTSNGSFAIQRPGKFRWHYRKPYEQLIVGDGKDVWLHDPDLNQVTVKQIDKALDSSPAALLSGDNHLEKRYRMKALQSRDNLNWVEAIPRQGDNNFNRVRIGFSGKEIRRMELEDSFGQTTRIEFRMIVVNSKPDAALFRFTPPKGADVVRQ
ncbi:outer membrane lipoprotein carrier protein [Formivibrio citricus]|uniref:Outer-membrane lipoprotein carrier protein n=1 Tax=Formivibrio citricus TaxID=83765 RepID=A0A1I4VCM0_9NEIS|nr:outer membrane lipoprotein chaperone LolA [Formivibrio citricus]SFM98922.1 outer membrane lipoprotein carrier protein [Formivibrio citricus]